VIGGLISSTFLTLFILPDFILIAEEIEEKLKGSGARLFQGFEVLKQRLNPNVWDKKN